VLFSHCLSLILFLTHRNSPSLTKTFFFLSLTHSISQKLIHSFYLRLSLIHSFYVTNTFCLPLTLSLSQTLFSSLTHNFSPTLYPFIQFFFQSLPPYVVISFSVSRHFSFDIFRSLLFVILLVSKCLFLFLFFVVFHLFLFLFYVFVPVLLFLTLFLWFSLSLARSLVQS
jgi:hypothetical protein